MKDEFYRKTYDEGGHKLPQQIMAAEIRTPSVVVVDHFYNDPDEVRNWAIEQTYDDPETHGAVGYRCERGRKIFDGTREAIENLMNGKVIEGKEEGQWDYSTNGCFQWCPAGTPVVFHCDSQQYAGAVYLDPNAPREAGTSLYRHKDTGIDWMPNGPNGNEECEKYFGQPWPVIHNAVFGKYQNHESNFLDNTLFEKTDEIANIYNRLVIWDARKIHSASSYYGDNIHNSRLFHLFFFNLEKEEDNI